MSTTQALIASLWKKNLPQIHAYLRLLEQAAEAEPLLEEEKKQAAATAHKLAGSLGMYGYPAGTEAARQLEQEFDLPKPSQSILRTLVVALRDSIE